jgi:hypothetical protein
VSDPALADRVFVDRFAPEAATVMVRTEDSGLPGANEPIDFDVPPFITQGLGPDGQRVRYYNFDAQEQKLARLYRIVRESDGAPLEGQLPIVDELPGEAGYNDFRLVFDVAVPDDFPANAISSLADIGELGFSGVDTERVENIPIVPFGSTASQRYGAAPADAVSLWYRGKVASAFRFEDDVLSPPSFDGERFVELSYIFVAFNVNPGEPGGGPPSGFATESDGVQTHNVVQTVPDMERYSPLWMVMPYETDAFDSVSDLETARSAPLVPGVDAPNVNCPVVEVGP